MFVLILSAILLALTISEYSPIAEKLVEQNHAIDAWIHEQNPAALQRYRADLEFLHFPWLARLRCGADTLSAAPRLVSALFSAIAPTLWPANNESRIRSETTPWSS